MTGFPSGNPCVNTEHRTEMIPIDPFIPERYKEDPALLEEDLRQARDRERYYRQQQKLLLQEQDQLDRKKRNHRIFTRGGMLESFMRAPLLLSDGQVYRLLETAFGTTAVREMETALIAEAARTASGDGAGWSPG